MGARPGSYVQRRFYVIFVYDDGRKGGAPEGATGVWRQWTSGFYPRLPVGKLEVAQRVADRFGTQARIVRVDFEASRIETIKVLDAR